MSSSTSWAKTMWPGADDWPDVEPVNPEHWDAPTATTAAATVVADPAYLSTLEKSLAALKAGTRRGNVSQGEVMRRMEEDRIRRGPSHAAHHSEMCGNDGDGDLELASLLGSVRDTFATSGDEGDDDASTRRCWCIEWIVTMQRSYALRQRRLAFSQLEALEEEPEDLPSSSDGEDWAH